LLPRKAAMAALMTKTISSLRPSAGDASTAGVVGGVAVCGFTPAAAASSTATRSPRRFTSRRSASRAPPTWAQSTASDFMRCSGLQRDQAVLLRRPAIALGLEVFERLGQVLAGVGRFDDVVHEAAAGGNVRRGERGAVRLDQLGAAGGLVGG